MKSENTNREKAALALLDEYRNGVDGSFSKLYNLYAVSLLNYGMCLTSNKELVKDCVHDVFVKLMVKCRQKKIEKIGSYLFISLRNRLLDEFRKDSFNCDTPIADVHMGKEESAESSYIKMEQENVTHSNVEILLNVLTPRQRKAFQLYFIDQRKYEDICEILNMSYPCVRNLVHRGMLKLRSSEAYKQIKRTRQSFAM